ncbi:MAG: hypothetical protein HY361_01555 [Candidatus Aenigmarchaeota archaeon]|nr:hypothetical protein [Candidatus Aenigmarchaeota archaeon]
MPMKEVGQFADPKAITPAATADATGSTSNDRIYAEAVFASMPTLLPYEQWFQVQDLPDGIENAFFSYVKNFDLTWTSVTGTGSDTGSSISSTAGPGLNWKEVRPELQVAELPVTYKVDIENQIANFDFYAKLGGQSVRKYLVQTALDVLDTAGSGTTDGTVGSVVRAAGGFATTGSINSGSTLTPSDLDDMKALLSTGSDIYVPDIVVMHTFQYNQLVKHQDFSLNSNSSAAMRATWDKGNLVAYNGMEIYHSELVNGYAAGNFYTVAGHPVFVFKKKVSACQALKSSQFQIKTIDMPRNFMKIKQFMIYESSAVLIPASIGLLRASD